MISHHIFLINLVFYEIFYIFIQCIAFLIAFYNVALTFVIYSDFLIIDSADLIRKQYCIIVVTNENPYL